MSKLWDLKQTLQEQLATAQRAAANHDDRGYATNMAGAANTQRAISAAENDPNNSIRRMQNPEGALLADGGTPGSSSSSKRAVLASPAYASAVHQWITSGGKLGCNLLAEHLDSIGGGFPLPTAGFSAALYEGSNTAGGYAVPVVVDDQIVPLAPSELAMRQISAVIPTSMDIKIPTKQSFSTATAKAETVFFHGIRTYHWADYSFCLHGGRAPGNFLGTCSRCPCLPGVRG